MFGEGEHYGPIGALGSAVAAGACTIVPEVAEGWITWASVESSPAHGRQIAAATINAAAETKITRSRMEEIVIRGCCCNGPYCTVCPHSPGSCAA